MKLMSLENAGPHPDGYTTEEHQSQIIKRHVIALINGVELFCWSSLNRTTAWPESYQRLALLNGLHQTTVAYDTYALLGTKLAGLTALEQIAERPLPVFRAECGDRSVLIAWSDDWQRTVRIDTGGSRFRVTDAIRGTWSDQDSGTWEGTVTYPVFVEALR